MNAMMKVTTAVLAAALLAVPASAARISARDAALFPARMLAAHNEVRASAGSAPLAWDDALGQDAARYAFKMAVSGRFAHSAAATRPNIGENLWMGTRGAYSPEAMVAGWSSERALFRPGKFPAVSRNGRWEDVGHYTQMVWPQTRKVGCATASTGGTDYLVCRYWPAGNVIGQVISR